MQLCSKVDFSLFWSSLQHRGIALPRLSTRSSRTIRESTHISWIRFCRVRASTNGWLEPGALSQSLACWKSSIDWVRLFRYIQIELRSQYYLEIEPISNALMMFSSTFHNFQAREPSSYIRSRCLLKLHGQRDRAALFSSMGFGIVSADWHLAIFEELFALSRSICLSYGSELYTVFAGRLQSMHFCSRVDDHWSTS